MRSAAIDAILDMQEARFQAAGLFALEREARSKLIAAWDSSAGCEPCRAWEIARAAVDVLKDSPAPFDPWDELNPDTDPWEEFA